MDKVLVMQDWGLQFSIPRTHVKARQYPQVQLASYITCLSSSGLRKRPSFGMWDGEKWREMSDFYFWPPERCTHVHTHLHTFAKTLTHNTHIYEKAEREQSDFTWAASNSVISYYQYAEGFVFNVLHHCVSLCNIINPVMQRGIVLPFPSVIIKM